jgi:hypothetical protein
VSDGNLAWLQRAGGADNEVFMTPVPGQITGNATEESDIDLDGDVVVWLGVDPVGGDLEVYQFIASGPSAGFYQVSNDNLPNGRPRVSGQLVTWSSGEGDAAEVWFGSGPNGPTRITNDGVEDVNPVISGDLIVWQRWDGNDYEIFYRTAGNPSLVQLTTNDWNDRDPEVSGNHIVWVADEPSGAQIWVSWNLGPPERVTNVPFDHGNPRIDGENIVFERHDGNDTEIVFAPEPRTTAAVSVALATLALLATRSARRAVAGTERRG